MVTHIATSLGGVMPAKSVDITGAWTKFWAAISGSISGLSTLMVVMGGLIAAAAVVIYIMERRKGGGGSAMPGASTWWMLVLAALLIAPQFVIGLFVWIIDIAINLVADALGNIGVGG